jgi:histidine triad (HIT) family protein
MDDSPGACVFCDIVAGAEDADVVHQDDVAVAFLDRRPLFPGHTLVVPAPHVVQLTELPASRVGPFFARVQLIATIMPTALDVPGTFVAMNNIVSQSVAHLHAHVVPRRPGDGLRGFFWPRHQYADGQAVEFADRLRATLASFDTETFLADR